MSQENQAVVKIIHMASGGAPIIAKMKLNQIGNEYELEDPLYLMYIIDEDGTERLKVNNLMAFSDEDSILVDRSHVMFSYTPMKKILQHYNDTLTNQLTKVDDAYGEVPE